MPEPYPFARAGLLHRAVSGLLALALALALVAGPTGAQAARKHRHPHAPAQQDGSKPDAAMLHVDLPTRIEQRCNARVMGDIGRANKDMRPDETVAYAFSDPKLGEASIEAPGAAVRSRGHWYHLSYSCRTSADGMDVLSLTYQLGDEVPREDWSAHSLVP